MFRANVYPSSGEITVSMRYGANQSTIRSDKYQVSHRYSYFSWWWAHSRPKHVEKRNKHTKENCAPSWLCLQVSVNLWLIPLPKIYPSVFGTNGGKSQEICLHNNIQTRLSSSSYYVKDCTRNPAITKFRRASGLSKCRVYQTASRTRGSNAINSKSQNVSEPLLTTFLPRNLLP
jgi:hypothetical protein